MKIGFLHPRRDGPRFLLGSAVAFYLFHYLPMWVLNGINSDMLIPVVFYEDIVREGRSCRDWVWGGASFLFPDLSLVWLLDFLTGNGLVALQVAGIFYFLAWPLLLVAIYKLAGGRRIEVFAALAVVFAVGVSSPVGLHAGLTPYETFCHSGGFLVVLAALVLTQMILARWRTGLAALLILLIALGSASDALVFPNFACAACGALTLEALRERDRAKRCVALGALIFLSGVAGLCLAQPLFPVRLAGGYAGLRLETVPNSVSVFCRNLDFSRETLRSSLMILDVITVPLLAWLLWLTRSWHRRIPQGLYFVAAFGGFVIACNWGAALASGDYTDLGSTRYVVLALLMPSVLLLGWLSEVFLWKGRSRALLLVAGAIFVGAIALDPPAPAGYVTAARAFAPLMRGIMDRDHIDAGLGDYWQANSLTFLSGQSVPVRSIDGTGGIDRWFNNAKWYEGDGAAPPAFGFIVSSPNDETPGWAQRFGPPAQKIAAPHGLVVWLYAPGDAIRFNRIFGVLGNARTFPDPTQMHLPAAAFSTVAGMIEGSALSAREGHSPVNYLTMDAPVHPVAGRYRVTYDYVYERPPMTRREVTFDCMVSTPGGEKILDRAPLRWTGAGPARLTREIVIPENEAGDPLQARLFYHGSGDIRVDALTIDYLGK